MVCSANLNLDCVAIQNGGMRGLSDIPFPSLSQSQFKVFPHGAVNEEVRGGVDNEEPVVEAGQA